MFRRGKKKQSADTPAQPDDARVAQDMGRFAAAFVQGSSEEGENYTFALADARRLDQWINAFVAEQPASDVVDSVVLSMGAFVGELITRAGGGSWTFEPRTGAPGVMLRNGLVCFPLNKVRKRIEIGPEHSIEQFVEVAMSGERPPTTDPS